jgi:putative transposase
VNKKEETTVYGRADILCAEQSEMGIPVVDVCRKIGIIEQTFYQWKNKYTGMLPSDIKRLKQLDEENTNLKKLVMDLSLDKAMLQDALSKFSEACGCREAVWYLQNGIGSLNGVHARYFESIGNTPVDVEEDRQAFLRKRIQEIAAVRVRYGYRRIHVLLRREGWTINVNRVYRLYKDEGVDLRNRSKRRHSKRTTCSGEEQAREGHICWAMDFVSDQL